MSTSNRVPMTVAGERSLREELEHLKKVVRPEITKAIATAREHGDLKENAEYHAARDQQSFAEGRIQDIEAKLSNAQVIDIGALPVSEKVIFGATVVLINLDTDDEVTYQLVGDDEADVKSGKISINSPIARGIIGKSVGDEVSIQIPAGVTEFEIDAVRYS